MTVFHQSLLRSMTFSWQESFYRFLNLCTKPRNMQDGFCFENWPKSVLKDMAVYTLTFHYTCCHFEMVFITITPDFENRYNFSKTANFQTGIKGSLPKNFFLLTLGLMHPTITCKLKSSEKDFSRVLSPKLWFCHFSLKKLCMTGKSFAAKAVLINR